MSFPNGNPIAKRLLAVLLALCLLMTGTAWAEPITMLVNGQPFTLDLPALSANPETLAQAQALVEALGLELSYNLQQQAIELKRIDSGTEQRISLLEWALSPHTAENAVRSWAQSVLRRNGAWKYAVSSPEERAKSLIAPYWVTGVSSPWADDFEIEPIKGEPSLDSGQFRVRFFWWTSTGLSGQSEQRVLAKRDSSVLGEPWLITVLPLEPSQPSETTLAQPAAPSNRPAEPNSSTTSPSVSMLRIPFLTTRRTTGEFMHQSGYAPVIQSFWNLSDGKLELNSEVLFEMRREGQQPDVRLAWDGSERVVVIPEGDSQIRLIPADKPEHRTAPLLMTETKGIEMVAANPDHDETLVIRTLWEESQKLQLEIHSATGVTIVPLSTANLTLGHTPLRPVALQWDGEVIHCYLESIRDSQQDGGWSLLEAVLDRNIGKGDVLAWRVVSEDLGISEAGAGTRMVKLGDSLYIGRQEGTVTRVSLKTGEQFDCPEINDALALFRRRYAPVVVGGPNPSTLCAFGDTLIVSWSHHAAKDRIENGELIEDYEWVNCTLAVSDDGSILGQVNTVDSRVAVYKDGNVTQLIMLSSPANAWGMLFPTPNS